MVAEQEKQELVFVRNEFEEMATQEQYGPRGVAMPMLSSRSSRTGRVTATTLEDKGLTQTGVRKFINKSDEKDAAAKAREGVESSLQEWPDGDRRANGSSDGRHVVRLAPCAPKVPHAPNESRSRTTAEMRRRKYFVETQLGTAEAEQSTESGEVYEERGHARVQRTRKEGALSRRAMPSSFAKCTKTNERKKTRFVVPQEVPNTNFDEQDVDEFERDDLHKGLQSALETPS